jgi:uroporphyrinogen-III synthase
MKLLITRPLERVEPLKSRLQALGHEVISMPLFQIIPLEFEPFDAQTYDDIIVTSAFAADFVPEGTNFRYLAGQKKEIGQGSKCLYLRGEYVSETLPCDERIVYTTKSVEKLDPLEIDGVLLFSARTGEIFESLWKGSRNIDVFCLSKEIAQTLQYAYQKIHIAPVATLEGMMKLYE